MQRTLTFNYLGGEERGHALRNMKYKQQPKTCFI